MQESRCTLRGVYCGKFAENEHKNRVALCAEFIAENLRKMNTRIALHFMQKFIAENERKNRVALYAEVYRRKFAENEHKNRVALCAEFIAENLRKMNARIALHFMQKFIAENEHKNCVALYAEVYRGKFAENERKNRVALCAKSGEIENAVLAGCGAGGEDEAVGGEKIENRARQNAANESGEMIAHKKSDVQCQQRINAPINAKSR